MMTVFYLLILCKDGLYHFNWMAAKLYGRVNWVLLLLLWFVSLFLANVVIKKLNEGVQFAKSVRQCERIQKRKMKNTKPKLCQTCRSNADLCICVCVCSWPHEFRILHLFTSDHNLQINYESTHIMREILIHIQYSYTIN